MARQGLLFHHVCDRVSGGRESDLISINCAGPAGVLGPHMVFGRCVPEGLQWGQHRETARCTHSL